MSAHCLLRGWLKTSNSVYGTTGWNADDQQDLTATTVICRRYITKGLRFSWCRTGATSRGCLNASITHRSYPTMALFVQQYKYTDLPVPALCTAPTLLGIRLLFDKNNHNCAVTDRCDVAFIKLQLRHLGQEVERQGWGRAI